MTKVEGTSGTTNASFTVTRAGSTSGTQTVAWSVAGSGSAPADAVDFAGGVLPSGVLTFTAGQTSRTIVVPIAGDTQVEADETYTVTLSAPSSNATITRAVANGVIRSDDAGLAIAATDANKSEGQSGSTDFTFTVTRTGDTSIAHGVAWAMTGDAASASDFAGGVLPSGTLSFAVSETSKLVTVQVAGDTLVEADEGFTVTLSTPSAGAYILGASAAGSIRNDDASLAIAATDADKAEGNAGATSFAFTVTRSGDTSLAHSAACGGQRQRHQHRRGG